ncbi:hypothetical protein ACFVZM_06500 [Streptomyces sioyaensis]|uniref:hypothetical protein n=1 Tax=Streptomyces sioyaensis TaxID=67364 RepID=UPI0036C75BD0
MKRETYKGRKIKVVAGRGADWGYTRITLNGVDMGKWVQGEDEALRSTRGTIDHADEVGISSGRYGAEWYASGTYDLCDEGHAKEIGGECGHHWCVEQRAAAAPIVDERRAERTPYDADHVAIVDMGHTVWALYIPDPEHAKDPQAVADNLCDRKYTDVEMVASTQRFYKKDGAAFSGWVVEGNGGYSDGIPRKPDAMKELKYVVAGHFKRPAADTVKAVGAPDACIHANVSRPDVLGDPATACRNMSSGEDFGAFNDEGCFYAYGCAVDVANEAAKENEEAEAPADDPYATWHRICREHEEQRADTCEQCHEGDAGSEDEADEE